LIFQLICFLEKLKILETSSIVVNAILYMTYITTDKMSY